MTLSRQQSRSLKSSVAILILAVLFSALRGVPGSYAQPNKLSSCVWKNAKTGASVADYPYRAEPDPADPNRAIRKDLGISFVRENGVWKNSQNGVIVRTYPLRAESDPSDPKKAFRSDTGESFYLDCPPGVIVPPLPGAPQQAPVAGGEAGPAPQVQPTPSPLPKKSSETSPFPLPTWLIKNPNPPPVKEIPFFDVAAPFDACLVGSWRSEPVGANVLGVTGGEGILISFKSDGTQSIDYNGMQPFQGGFGDKNYWTGTAEGHVMTDHGIAKIKSVERSDIIHKYVGPNGTRTNSLSGSMGPAGLGNNPMDSSYRCDESKLTFKDPGRTYVYKRLGAPEPVKSAVPNAAPRPDGLAPPSIPDAERKLCEPKYSEAMAEADSKSRDAVMTRRAAETFRSSGMNSKKTAEGDRQLSEFAKGTLMKAISNGDKKAEADLRQQIAEYIKRAELEEASAEYDLQRAASSEQRAKALEQEAELLRRDAIAECLQKSGTNK